MHIPTTPLYKIFALLCALTAMADTAVAQTDANPKVNESTVWYKARHGDGAAMNQVGVWYYTGNKVAKDYRQAYYWWSKGAMAQNPKAAANLGVCYQYGRGAERDSVAAMQLYLTAIENGQQDLFDQRLSNAQNSTFDSMLIGLCYERGIGVRRDLKGAAGMYAKAADKGSTDGMSAAGRAYLEYGDLNSALRYLDKAAAAGDLESGYLAAKARLDREPASSGAETQAAEIRRAAEAGIPAAAADLGMMYLQGKGVPADRSQAMEWLRRGAQDGDVTAMWQYGNALKTDRDYDEALFWLSMAAVAGMQDDFSSYIDKLPDKDGFKHYVNGIKAYLVDKDYRKATAELQSVGKSEHEEGKVMEMVVLADANNDRANSAKAAKELARMSDENPLAAQVLAALYLDGNGVSRDSGRAISLYRQAANADYAGAQDALAAIYYDGRLTSADRQQAMVLYGKAYQQRRISPTGLSRLRLAYTNGDYGLKADQAMVDRLGHYNDTDPVLEALKAL